MGQEKIIDIIEAENWFAESLAFMPHGRYPYSAAALQTSALFSFDNSTLLKLLQDSNKLCLRMLSCCGKNLHAELREIDNLTLQNATFRIVSYLMDLLPNPCSEIRRD